MPRCGFTMVELMVSMGISTIILLVLLECFSQVLTSWTLESKREHSLREGRSGLQLLAQDLKTAITLPQASTAADEARRERFQIKMAADRYASAGLAFLHTSSASRKLNATKPDRGDVKLVAYAMALSTDAGGATSQKLWRKEYATEETWKRIQAHIGAAQPLITEVEWTDFTKKDTGTPPKYEVEPVTYEAVRLEVLPLTVQSTGTTPTLEPATTWDAKDMPRYLDITLRVTNRPTATRLSTLADWRGQGQAAAMLLGKSLTPDDYSDDPEARTFTMRVGLDTPIKPSLTLP
jgi:prepilin-type N-terminal cleavage/methylation domain-containing protein